MKRDVIVVKDGAAIQCGFPTGDLMRSHGASSHRLLTRRRHSKLILDALGMALWQRRTKYVINDSYQGSQNTSLAFGLCCKKVVDRRYSG